MVTRTTRASCTRFGAVVLRCTGTCSARWVGVLRLIRLIATVRTAMTRCTHTHTHTHTHTRTRARTHNTHTQVMLREVLWPVLQRRETEVEPIQPNLDF
jgi:hypothetical protein